MYVVCALLYDQPRPPIVMLSGTQHHYLICQCNIGLYSAVLASLLEVFVKNCNYSIILRNHF